MNKMVSEKANAEVLAREVAKGLLSIGAVFLRPDQPFTWASGIKSPIYCDNRLVLTAPAVREAVEKGIAQVVGTEFPDCEVLMGTATAGIAHAAIAGYLLGMPMGYVRSGAKDHGRANRIEGKLDAGAKVVVVEDLISTGKSSLEAVDALREAGADVIGMVSIFTYGMKAAKEKFAAAGVKENGTGRSAGGQSLYSRYSARGCRRGRVYPCRRLRKTHCFPRQSVGRKVDDQKINYTMQPQKNGG